MIEWWQLAILFVSFAVYLLVLVIIFARMIAALLMGLVSHIPELIKGGAAEVLADPPIPKVKIMDAVGYGLVKAIQSPKSDELIGTVMSKIGGEKKP
jgi:hypothetical protein